MGRLGKSDGATARAATGLEANLLVAVTGDVDVSFGAGAFVFPDLGEGDVHGEAVGGDVAAQGVIRVDDVVFAVFVVLVVSLAGKEGVLGVGAGVKEGA